MPWVVDTCLAQDDSVCKLYEKFHYKDFLLLQDEPAAIGTTYYCCAALSRNFLLPQDDPVAMVLKD